MEGNFSLYVIIMPGFVALCIVVDIIFLIYHITSHDHMFKGCVTLWLEASNCKSVWLQVT